MTALTISLDDQIAEKARRVAKSRNTDLENLVCEYVQEIAEQEEGTQTRLVEEPQRSFDELSRPMGGPDWSSREELHER